MNGLLSLKAPFKPKNISLRESLSLEARVRKLFAAGEQGAWYDASDLGNYKSLGSELVTNGGFDSGSGWTLEAAWAISGGVATYTDPGGAVSYIQTNTASGLVANKWYQFSVKISGITGGLHAIFGLLNINASANLLGSYQAIYADGTYTYTFLCPSDTAGIRFYGNATGTVASFSIDNLSVKEIILTNPTMYQDAAGTTPVTAVEQPVGLVLDKRLGTIWNRKLTSTTGPVIETGGTTPPVVVENTTYLGKACRKITFTLTGTGGYALSRCILAKPPTTLSKSAVKIRAKIALDQAIPAGLAFQIYAQLTADFNSPYGPFINSATPSGVWVDYVVGDAIFGVPNGTVPNICLYPQGGTFAGQIISIYVTDITVDELSGNHAFQSTTTKRPILRARHNLLTYSEQLDNAVWAKSQVNVSADVDGVADKLIPTTTSDLHFLSHNTGAVTGSQTWFIEAKAAGLNKVSLREGLTSGAYVTFSLIDGSVISFGNGANGYGSVDLGDGWFRLYLVHNPAGNFGRKINLVPNSYTTGDPNSIVFSGDGTSGVLVRVAQCNYGATALPYQRIAAPTDYDTVGFPHYWDLDGTDDSWATANIDFTSTDKMSIFAGVRKNNDAGTIVAELSANANTNAGTITLVSGTNIATAGYDCLSRGSAAATSGQLAYKSSLTAPHTGVLSSTHDIAGDLSTLRVNGVSGTNGTADKGAGNFGNYPLYIGQRAGSSLPLNGRIYSLIVLGRTATAAEITATEAWVNSKTGAY